MITLAYLWLPYMVIPVYAGFERVPRSLFEASSDLGAGAGRTVRSVLVPLVFPAIAAGSIFTFSLTLGDYIAVGHRRRQDPAARQRHLRAAGDREQPAARGGARRSSRWSRSCCTCCAMRRTGALENV